VSRRELPTRWPSHLGFGLDQLRTALLDLSDHFLFAGDGVARRSSAFARATRISASA